MDKPNFEAHIANDSEIADAVKRYMLSSGKSEFIGISLLEIPDIAVEIVTDFGTQQQTLRLQGR